jgi:hypothetical protein
MWKAVTGEKDDVGPPAGRCDRQRWLRWTGGFGRERVCVESVQAAEQ